MARNPKRNSQGSDTNSSDEFEEVDLMGNLPNQDSSEDQFEQVDLQTSRASIQPSFQKLKAAQEVLEQNLIFNVTEQAFSAQAGTDSIGFENIIGVGISEKTVNGRFTGRNCVTVFVVEKVPDDELHPEARVPKLVNGVMTDVVAVGEIQASVYRGRYRPAPGGVSLGHYQITAGTLGCLVRRGNQLFILSNNHVMANSNNAQIGDPILQPGPYDGGSLQTDVVARLSQFVPIQFGDVPNFVDCAIAQSMPPIVTPNNISYGRINEVSINPSLFTLVKKAGRTTQFTRGLIVATNVTIRVSYGTQGTALFQNQFMVGNLPGFPFSQGGDSGSLIVNNSNQPVGLLFAGSTFVTIANPINAVLNSLGVSIYTG